VVAVAGGGNRRQSHQLAIVGSGLQGSAVVLFVDLAGLGRHILLKHLGQVGQLVGLAHGVELSGIDDHGFGQIIAGDGQVDLLILVSQSDIPQGFDLNVQVFLDQTGEVVILNGLTLGHGSRGIDGLTDGQLHRFGIGRKTHVLSKGRSQRTQHAQHQKNGQQFLHFIHSFAVLFSLLWPQYSTITRARRIDNCFKVGGKTIRK